MRKKDRDGDARSERDRPEGAIGPPFRRAWPALSASELIRLTSFGDVKHLVRGALGEGLGVAICLRHGLTAPPWGVHTTCVRTVPHQMQSPHHHQDRVVASVFGVGNQNAFVNAVTRTTPRSRLIAPAPLMLLHMRRFPRLSKSPAPY